ncbi:MAG: secretin N-terminal domain-containing protein [candidate division WOR-3 bacterium]
MYKKIFLLCLLLPCLTFANPKDPELTNIEVRKTNGYTEILFTLTDYATFSEFTMDHKLVLDLLETTSALSGNFWEVNRGGVENIALSYISAASLTRVVIQRSDNYTYEISNPTVNTISIKLNTNTNDFTPWSAKEEVVWEEPKKEEEVPPIKTEPSQETVSMRLENADLATTLRSIAQVSGMNIIIGDEVKGTISVELNDVEWEKAMDLILKTKGYTYIIENNVIRVGSPATFAKEREDIELSQPLKRGIYVLEFTTPKEVEGAVKSLLSKRGTVEIDTRTNSIIVNDIPSKLEAVESLIKALDKKTPQVAITSKIVDIDQTAARELGLAWEVTNLKATPFNLKVEAEHVLPPEPTAGAFINVATVQDWGALASKLIALEQAQKLEIHSNPRVTTVNNKEARIFGGKRFAITALDINGQPITRWYTAGIELKVTPHINAAGDITMDLSVELSDVVPGTNNTVVTETRSETQTLVKDGQTIVIGGFYTKTITERKSGVPILKNIPIIGAAFGHNQKEERKREVLIFITPHIVEPEVGKNI